jgi:hypothetical protein
VAGLEPQTPFATEIKPYQAFARNEGKVCLRHELPHAVRIPARGRKSSGGAILLGLAAAGTSRDSDPNAAVPAPAHACGHHR